MSAGAFEEALAAAVAANVVPLAEELRRLAAEVAALRDRLPPLLVTVEEAARLNRVSVKTIRRGIADGSIPYRRVGRTVRVDLSRMHGLDGDDVARMAREARR